MLTAVPAARVPSRLTANQIRGFWAAWGGWALDGMDASIYAVVLVPALADLLPRPGIAALANYFIGANFGWRWMFALGGAPALLVSWIRRGVRESAAWQQNLGDAARVPKMSEAFLKLFSPKYRRRTIVNSLLFLVSIIGLWAGSIYVPAAVTQI